MIPMNSILQPRRDIQAMFAKYSTVVLALIISVAVWFMLSDVAHACPTCKDTLADSSGAERDLASGYGYSIVFMLSMPFVLVTSIGLYFYWEVRKARARVKAGLPYHAWQEAIHQPSASRPVPVSPGRGS